MARISICVYDACNYKSVLQIYEEGFGKICNDNFRKHLKMIICSIIFNLSFHSPTPARPPAATVCLMRSNGTSPVGGSRSLGDASVRVIWGYCRCAKMEIANVWDYYGTLLNVRRDNYRHYVDMITSTFKWVFCCVYDILKCVLQISACRCLL